MLSGRVIKTNLLTGLIKRILLYKMSYHSKTISHGKNQIKVELDFFNYAWKSGVKKKQQLFILKILLKRLI